MSYRITEEKIIQTLEHGGPMTSHELEVALNLSWTDFSTQLLPMVRTDPSLRAKVLSVRVPIRGWVYYLPGQIPYGTP